MRGDGRQGGVALYAAAAAVTLLAVFAAEFGRSFVQASAYGDEERFPLRPPAAVGARQWSRGSCGRPASDRAVAARRPVVDRRRVLTVAAIAGLGVPRPPLASAGRRWLVLVPAGVVLHDPVVLADTVSLRSAQVARIRLAPDDTDAADLTGPASGYALEVQTTESITAVFAFTPVGTERPGDPPDRLPRLPEPPRQRARRRRPPRPARRLNACPSDERTGRCRPVRSSLLSVRRCRRRGRVVSVGS